MSFAPSRGRSFGRPDNDGGGRFNDADGERDRDFGGFGRRKHDDDDRGFRGEGRRSFGDGGFVRLFLTLSIIFVPDNSSVSRFRTVAPRVADTTMIVRADAALDAPTTTELREVAASIVTVVASAVAVVALEHVANAAVEDLAEARVMTTTAASVVALVENSETEIVEYS